ncbi:MAG: glycosyltransferase family 4 protein [Chloroflexales bacterium]|nr:glycosyltransferase family 4 protein [Chloroflexales bacterium]
MRVGISCEFIGTKRNGTATYSRALLAGIARYGGEHEYVAYLSAPEARAMIPRAATITPRMVYPYLALVRVPLTLPVELLHRPVDLVHTQNWAPPWTPCPLIVTTHDVVWEAHPEMFPRALGARVRLLAHLASRRATLIVTSSHYSAHDIARLHRVSLEKIRVIPPPLDLAIAPVVSPAARAPALARYGITRPYILYVGSIEPRKNVDGLIRAYAALRRAHGVAHQLVIAGQPLYLFQQVLDLPAQLGLRHDVVFTGRVADEDLPAVYSGADLFATLAVYEGFGLPPLEAMACGVPVVAAAAAALPESVGDGGLLVDPADTRAVVTALARALNDPGLRAELRARGHARVRALGLEPITRQVVAAYEECLDRARRPGAARRQGRSALYRKDTY